MLHGHAPQTPREERWLHAGSGAVDDTTQVDWGSGAPGDLGRFEHGEHVEAASLGRANGLVPLAEVGSRRGRGENAAGAKIGVDAVVDADAADGGHARRSFAGQAHAFLFAIGVDH
jgi:hypothetical protein